MAKINITECGVDDDGPTFLAIINTDGEFHEIRVPLAVMEKIAQNGPDPVLVAKAAD